jgi:hypothetical protein
VISTIWVLAWRSLWDRPRRTLVLLLGYGVGVAVMIALLSVGEALLAQAQDRDLVAGGDVVLLPEGVDPAVLKVNGAADLSFTIQAAGFVVREVLAGPRFAQAVAAAAPQIDARQIYVRRRDRVLPALASAGIPSLDHAARATGAVPGAEDSPADHAWMAPSAGQLLDRLDRFHRVPRSAGPTWAEWDYFTFTDPRSGAYGYLTALVGGEGRGAVLVRIRRPGQPVEDVSIPARIAPGDLSERSADQHIGPARIRNDGGRYHVTVNAPRVTADLWVTPDAGFYLPPGEISGDMIVSGYVVPVVRGSASGYVRTARGEVRLAGAPAYHDHNWGTWRGVTWEWGEASGSGGALLYGGLHVAGAGGGAPATTQRPPVLFAWRSAPADGRPGQGGFLGGFPVRSIAYSGWHPGPTLEGRRLSIPSLVTIDAGAGSDRIAVDLHVRDGLASAAAQVAPASGAAGKRQAPRAAFLQLRGTAEVRGTVDGRPVAFSGGAAAETFVPFPR